MSTYVHEIELSKGIEYCEGLDGYDRALVLLRLSGSPVGTINVPCHNGILRPGDVVSALGADTGIKRNLIARGLDEWLLRGEPSKARYPDHTIVVFAEDHDRLGLCLGSLCRAEGHADVIVVGDMPIRPAIPEQIGGHRVLFMAYGCDAHGLPPIKGDVIIFIDGRTIVDQNWLSPLTEPFHNPRIAAAIGPEVPFELENDAQELYDLRASYRQGFGRRIMDYYTMAPSGVGLVECCSNVAIRREHVDLARLVESADDRQCTIAYAIKRALYSAISKGYQVIYAPDAVTRHIHPEDISIVYRTLAEQNDVCMAYLLDCYMNAGDWQSLSVGGAYFLGLLRRRISARLRPSLHAGPPKLYAFNLPHGVGLFTGRRRHAGISQCKAGTVPGQVGDQA